jgi:hypothetical protein
MKQLRGACHIKLPPVEQGQWVLCAAVADHWSAAEAWLIRRRAYLAGAVLQQPVRMRRLPKLQGDAKGHMYTNQKTDSFQI